MAEKRKSDAVVIIKKYANRRLYNTDTSVYVTLDDLYDMVKQNVEFEVRDAKTNEDLTRSVLTQIIFDREAKGANNLMPLNFLKTIIGFYDEHGAQPFLPAYLDASLKMFEKHQERWVEMMQASPFTQAPIAATKQFSEAMEQFNPMHNLEEMTRRNLDFFEQAMGMMNPFGIGQQKKK